VTTAEFVPPYEVIASPGKPVGPSIIIDQHQQPKPSPHPHSPVAVDNISLAAVHESRPLPPTDVRAVRQPDGGVLIQWTLSRDHVDHYSLQYRTVGGWLPLADRLDADTTSHVWTTASRGVYSFRLLSVSHNLLSLPSNVATLEVDGVEFLSLL